MLNLCSSILSLNSFSFIIATDDRPLIILYSPLDLWQQDIRQREDAWLHRTPLLRYVSVPACVYCVAAAPCNPQVPRNNASEGASCRPHLSCCGPLRQANCKTLSCCNTLLSCMNTITSIITFTTTTTKYSHTLHCPSSLSTATPFISPLIAPSL